MLFCGCHSAATVIPAPVQTPPQFNFYPFGELYQVNAQPPTIRVVPLVAEDGLVLEGGDKVHIKDTYIFPIPATELASLSVTIEQATQAFSYPFAIRLTGDKVVQPLHDSGVFLPKDGYVYKALDLSAADAPKELQKWEVPIIHFAWTGVADNTGKALKQDRYYAIQTQ